MPVDRLYIARHGFRLSWVTTTWKSETGLPRDPPLAAFGVSQAKELAAFFLSLPENERPTAIFSSPYYRCLQTSQPTAVALNLPIYVEHGLSEWYSPVQIGTGLHPRPYDAKTLQTYFPEIDPSWSSIYYPSRKGEDVAQVHERTGAFLDAFMPEVERRFPVEQHARVLLVSHAATVITLARVLLSDRELPIRVGCCSLTDMKRKEGEKVLGGWEPTKLADGAHLSEGASREWGFEDIEISRGEVIPDPGEAGSQDEDEGPVGLQLSEKPTSNL